MEKIWLRVGGDPRLVAVGAKLRAHAGRHSDLHQGLQRRYDALLGLRLSELHREVCGRLQSSLRHLLRQGQLLGGLGRLGLLEGLVELEALVRHAHGVGHPVVELAAYALAFFEFDPGHPSPVQEPVALLLCVAAFEELADLIPD
jgi:hypothetical protein